MSPNPYNLQPQEAFWSRAVARNYNPASLVRTAHGRPRLLTTTDKVMSAGSCFAANIVPHLQKQGIHYVKTEPTHPEFSRLEENLGYDNFSAAYGNIYTARQFLQLLLRAVGEFHPREDRWYSNGRVIDCFRPGLRYAAVSNVEFEALTAQHLKAVRQAVREATVVIFTFGLTEAWVSNLDGAVFPACPGTVAGSFDPDLHRFKNFSYEEVRDDTISFCRTLRQINPDIRIIFTVSPVPLVATATANHVLTASTYSKSVLRAAVGAVSEMVRGVEYFPAYEIVTGPQAPEEYFKGDRRNVSESAVQTVMSALLYNDGDTSAKTAEHNSSDQLDTASERKHESASVSQSATDQFQMIAEAIIAAECEEEMMDESMSDSAGART